MTDYRPSGFDDDAVTARSVFSIAFALVVFPALLVLDNPTASRIVAATVLALTGVVVATWYWRNM